MVADLLVAFLDITLDHNTLYQVMDVGRYLTVVHDFLDDTDLLLELFAGIGMVDIHNGGRVDQIHLGIHVAEAHQVLIVIVLCGIAVFADGAAAIQRG